MKTYLPRLLQGEDNSLAVVMRNALLIEQFAPNGELIKLPCGYPAPEFYTYQPDLPVRLALVIGTYASVPYVHLGLESWKRNYSHIPLLVHDDCSPKREKLKELCMQYGAYFGTNTLNLGHTIGDMSSFYHGIQWAKDRGNIDILVKFSRRFLPLYNWTNRLEITARSTQYPTFSNICQNLNWGFRSECLGIHIPTWDKSGVFDIVRKELLWKTFVYAEPFWHELAKMVHKYTSPANIQYVLHNPKEDWRSAYADWDIMGTSRIKKVDGLMWHHSCQPAEYYAVSSAWNLPYTISDFGLPEGAFD